VLPFPEEHPWIPCAIYIPPGCAKAECYTSNSSYCVILCLLPALLLSLGTARKPFVVGAGAEEYLVGYAKVTGTRNQEGSFRDGRQKTPSFKTPPLRFP
jgi:hypothetical protein